MSFIFGTAFRKRRLTLGLLLSRTIACSASYQIEHRVSATQSATLRRSSRRRPPSRFSCSLLSTMESADRCSKKSEKTAEGSTVCRFLVITLRDRHGAGNWAGGWRVLLTLGHKIVRMQPIHGFALEATGATIPVVAGNLGMPVSTTRAITASVMGGGVAKRPSALELSLIERIIRAWILIIPVTGA